MATPTVSAVCPENQPLCDAFIAESLKTPINRERYQSKAQEIADSATPVTEADLRGPYNWPGRIVLQMARLEAGGQDALFPPEWSGLLEDDERIADAVELLRLSVEYNHGKTYNAWCDMGCYNDHREEAMDYYGDLELEVQQWILGQIETLVREEEPPEEEGECEGCGKPNSDRYCDACVEDMDETFKMKEMDKGRGCRDCGCKFKQTAAGIRCRCGEE
jgi:hypothetical protein